MIYSSQVWGDLHEGMLHFGRSSCLHTSPWAEKGPGEPLKPPVTAPLFTDIRFMFSEPPTAGEASVCRTPFTAEAAKADKVIRLTANRATFGPWQPGSSLAHHHHTNHLSQYTRSEGSATGNCRQDLCLNRPPPLTPSPTSSPTTPQRAAHPSAPTLVAAPCGPVSPPGRSCL